MSEATENPTADATEDLATDAKVNEAFEELVRNVEVPEEAAAPKKAAAKPRKATVKVDPAAQKNVDALVETVSSLVRSVEVLTERIPVPTAPVEEPVVEEVAEVEPEDNKLFEGDVSMKTVAVEHALTLANYLGLGLVAAGVMQTGTAMIAMTAVGVILFTVAAVVTGRKNGNVIKLATGSLLLAVGLGMIVGGAQFFGEEPKRAAILIPVGLPLFMAGMVLRSGWKLNTEHIAWVAGAAVWLCMGLFMGLNTLADSMTKEDAPAETSPAAEAPAPPAEHGAEAPAAAGGEHGTEAATPASAEHGATEPAATEPAAAASGEHGAATTEEHSATATATAPAADAHATEPKAPEAAHATEPAAAADSHKVEIPAKASTPDVAATVGKINSGSAH